MNYDIVREQTALLAVNFEPIVVCVCVKIKSSNIAFTLSAWHLIRGFKLFPNNNGNPSSNKYVLLFQTLMNH
jgi:hypothetical protein